MTGPSASPMSWRVATAACCWTLVRAAGNATAACGAGNPTSSDIVAPIHVPRVPGPLPAGTRTRRQLWGLIALG